MMMHLALQVVHLTVVVTTSSSQETYPAASDLASITARRADDINRRGVHRDSRTSIRERKNN